jgi:hypothetical protein
MKELTKAKDSEYIKKVRKNLIELKNEKRQVDSTPSKKILTVGRLFNVSPEKSSGNENECGNASLSYLFLTPVYP